MPITASLIAGGVLGAAQVGMGAAQYIQGRKVAKSNVRPEYQVQEAYQGNLDTARYLAQRGIGEKSLQHYTNNSERGLQSTIDAQLQTGASPNAVANAYDIYNQGLSKVAAADSEAWVRNVNDAIKANYAFAEEKSKAWALNKYEPFKDTAQAASAQTSAGVNNMFKGANSAVSALSMYGTSQLYDTQPKSPQVNNGQTQVDMQRNTINATNDYLKQRYDYSPNANRGVDNNGGMSSRTTPRVDMTTFDWSNYVSDTKQNIPNIDNNVNTQVKSNSY
jgi:hypothetical protein